MARQLALQSIIQLLPGKTETEALRFGLYWIKGLAKSAQAWPPDRLNRAASALCACKSSDQDTIQAFYTSAASFLLPSEEEKADRNKSENGIVSQAEHYIHTNYAQPISPVSYTHLDVYKRQSLDLIHRKETAIGMTIRINMIIATAVA